MYRELRVKENSFSKSEIALLNLDFTIERLSLQILHPSPLYCALCQLLSLCQAKVLLLLVNVVFLGVYDSWLLLGEEKKEKMGTDCRRLFSLGEELEITAATGMPLRAQESTQQCQGPKDTCTFFLIQPVWFPCVLSPLLLPPCCMALHALVYQWHFPLLGCVPL